MKDENRSPILLAIDIGTSGVRAELFDQNGREIPGARVASYRAVSGADFSTIDARALLAEVVQTIDAVYQAQFPASSSRLELIAISCFWHSLVGVDADGIPTTPVLGWADNQSAAAAWQLRSRLDEAAIHSRTGCRIHPSYWPAKLLHLRTQDPAAYQATVRWLSFAEYLTMHLCGETSASVSMASGTGLLNQRNCAWDQELLGTLDVDERKLPTIAPANATRALTATYAERWPLFSGAKLFLAVGDGAANHIGAGCASGE